jgi:hypothetical protein
LETTAAKNIARGLFREGFAGGLTLRVATDIARRLLGSSRHPRAIFSPDSMKRLPDGHWQGGHGDAITVHFVHDHDLRAGTVATQRLGKTVIFSGRQLERA